MELEPLVPFNVGERVAFKEDHPTHPGMYGLVLSIYYVDDTVKFDVNIIKPADGEVDDPGEVYTATMEEIQ